MSWFYFIFYISNYYIFSALIFSHNILLMWHLSQFLCMNSVSVQSILHQAATLIICHYKKIMLSYQYILFLKSFYCCPNALKINVKLGTIASGWKHDCLWVKISVIYFKYILIFFLNTSFLMITCLSHLILWWSRKGHTSLPYVDLNNFRVFFKYIFFHVYLSYSRPSLKKLLACLF